MMETDDLGEAISMPALVSEVAVNLIRIATLARRLAEGNTLVRETLPTPPPSLQRAIRPQSLVREQYERAWHIQQESRR